MGPFDLGDFVEDSLTGLRGTVVGVTRWLHGTTVYGVQPRALREDGKPVEVTWLEAGRLAPCERHFCTNRGEPRASA